MGEERAAPEGDVDEEAKDNSPEVGPSDEAQRIRLKHPGRVPVICVPPESGSWKHRLLIPDTMEVREFADIARKKCSWAGEESQSCAGGGPLLGVMLMSEVDRQHKSPDGFLYVT